MIPVEDTHAPVIKFLMTPFRLQIRTLALLWIRRIRGESGKILEEIWAFGSESLDVDLGFCSLKVDLRDPTFDPLDDAVMGQVYPPDNNRSDPPPALNAVRLSRSLLKDILDPSTFRIVLKALRLWAERRCIYGKSFGYFGGVSWAIMVADACQRYPGASADDILMRLFQENAGRLKECDSWSDWTIILGDIMHREYGYRVFNPMNVDTQVPQIVTPCYPATYDVNQSTMERIRKEFLRAAHVKCGHWDSLWELMDFFATARYCLCIAIANRRSTIMTAAYAQATVGQRFILRR